MTTAKVRDDVVYYVDQGENVQVYLGTKPLGGSGDKVTIGQIRLGEKNLHNPWSPRKPDDPGIEHQSIELADRKEYDEDAYLTFSSGKIYFSTPPKEPAVPAIVTVNGGTYTLFEEVTYHPPTGSSDYGVTHYLKWLANVDTPDTALKIVEDYSLSDDPDSKTTYYSYVESGFTTSKAYKNSNGKWVADITYWYMCKHSKTGAEAWVNTYISFTVYVETTTINCPT